MLTSGLTANYNSG